MTIKFFVAGTPQGKARPRFTKTGRAYTPKSTVDYENTVKIMYRRVCGSAKFEKGVSLKMNITAYFDIPKSTSKKKRAQMLKGNIRPTKKPDADNIAKVIADSLNGLAYYDDAQLVDVNVRKFYGENEGVWVEIQEV